MKHLLFLVLSILTLNSCQKGSDTILQDKDYFYRLASKDVDGELSYSNVESTKLQVELVAESNGGGDDEDCNDYCKRHPRDPRCHLVPITLEYFRVYVSDNKVFATWKTSLEANLDHFELQRSEDAINYKTVAIIIPKGPSEYTIKDTYRK